MALNGYEALERTVAVGDLDADADSLKFAVMHIPSGRRFTVDAAYLSAEADVSAADTNYNTVYLRNNSKTGNAICSLANGPAATGTNITQAPVAMSTPADAYKEVGSDSGATVLYLTATKTGTGQAVAGLRVHIVGRWTK